ncbi:hypothetical protein FHG87_024654 [Trinorchestia longiramus]|nr:hypothetical protein FHG87_024654 [Trinorchestia longiramus]
MWLNVLPPRENFDVNRDKFFIREIHWDADPSLIKLHCGSMQLGITPSIFNVPASCLPSLKPAPRPPVSTPRTFDKVQTLQQKHAFLLVDEVQIRLNAEDCSPSSDLCKEGPVD